MEGLSLRCLGFEIRPEKVNMIGSGALHTSRLSSLFGFEMKKMLFLAFLLGLSGCARIDDSSYPSIELESRLKTYLRTRDAKPVFKWVEEYHGEASGHQMRITFVSWGNRNKKKMEQLLNSWPQQNRKTVFELLIWAAEDSGQKLEFKVPIEKPNKPIESDSQ